MAKDGIVYAELRIGINNPSSSLSYIRYACHVHVNVNIVYRFEALAHSSSISGHSQACYSHGL